MQKQFIYWILAIMSVTVAPPLYADTETENEILLRLVHEIDALTPILQEAKHQQDPNDKYLFQYKGLEADLHKVHTGILAHIHRTKDLPRHITPLRGDYQ